jgi:hypothetical protein
MKVTHLFFAEQSPVQEFEPEHEGVSIAYFYQHRVIVD